MGDTLPTDPSLQPVDPALEASGIYTNQIASKYLPRRRLRQGPRTTDPNLGPDAPGQQLDDCRTIAGWTRVIDKILNAAWANPDGSMDVVFTHDFALMPDDPKALSGAYIVYDIYSESPAVYSSRKGNYRERKPKLREVQDPAAVLVEAPDGTLRSAPYSVRRGQQWVWAQSFDVVMAFNVYADSWGRATEVTERFKDFMMLYTGAFKQLGLQELFYRIQTRDVLYSPPRSQELPTRMIFYDARVERQVTINYAEIEQILLSVGIENLVTGQPGTTREIALLEGTDPSPVLPENP